jgi:hypothetical protein
MSNNMETSLSINFNVQYAIKFSVKEVITNFVLLCCTS